MQTVMPITHCKSETCRAPIRAIDVFREKTVRNAPGHVVLMFTCPACGLSGRVVGSDEEWQARQGDEDDVSELVDQLVFGFHKDLTVLVDDVDGLVNIWDSYNKPPLREDLKQRCNCKECKGKYYGTR